MSSRLMAGTAAQSIPDQNWANRRVSVRRACAKETTSRVVARGELRVRQASIKDISLGGIALVLETPLKPGTRLLIQLKNHKIGLSYDLAARVVHSFRKPPTKWVIGCSFTRELTQDEFENLL
jgi:c-di-GMP-binding flagellar brake protein YcgR